MDGAKALARNHVEKASVRAKVETPSVRHARPLTVGLNCSFGAEQLRPHLKALSAMADTLLMAYPNAGLPNELGEYDEAAEETAAGPTTTDESDDDIDVVVGSLTAAEDAT